MIKLKLLFALLFISVGLLTVRAQDAPPEIIAIGNQNFCPGTSISIATSVSISDPDASDTTLDEVTVQISEGYVQNEDVLVLTGTHPNITSVFVANEGRMLLTGPATFNEFEAAILAIEFSTTQTVFTSDRSFSINLGNANFLPSTGHYYFYIDSFGIPWDTARDEAAALDFFGLQGYLATITTSEEAQLAGEQAPGAGWIGASDAQTENTWVWVTGPEAGTVFWQGAVNGNPVNGEFSFWNTGEPNNFGSVGEDYAHVTDPSVGLLGSWNDLPIGGDPDVNGPFHPKGYLVEFGGLPGDPEINLSAATILNTPRIENPQNAQGCEGDTFNLSVTTNVDEVIWYQDAALTMPVNNGNTFATVLTATTTFFITANFSGCTDSLLETLTVNVDEIPEVNNITIQQCDDQSADGISVFELSNFSGLIVNGNTTNAVSYFEDDLLTIPIDASNYTNTSNNQIIFAEVLDQSSGCFAIAEVTLFVAPPSNDTFDLDLCDDEIEDGLTAFNLSDLNDEVLVGMPATAQVSYFPTFEDALLNDNVLPNNYTNTIPDTETIFVKVTNGTECLGIFEVILIVNPLPELEPDETIIYCLNTFPEPITIDGGVLNGIPNNFFYNWSTGETTIAIDINETGEYFVDVTEVDGCTNRRNFTVIGSSTATDIELDVIDAVENNIVTVNVSGQGDYEFSLTSEIGPYQDNNTFNNVRSGIQTIYIRDRNGCGVVSEEFPVIGFPKFFTPNGDATNDFWTVDAFDEEFFANSRVQIFDRQGKLLTELSRENKSWDGRYNGNLMPSADYWFLVELSDGRTFTKHFSLKR